MDAARPSSGKRRRAEDSSGADAGAVAAPGGGAARFLRGVSDASLAARTTDVKLKARLRRADASARGAAAVAARAEALLATEEAGAIEAEGPLERTWRLPQAAIRAAVGVGVARRAVALALEDYGPYTAAWARNGRQLLLAGAPQGCCLRLAALFLL